MTTTGPKASDVAIMVRELVGNSNLPIVDSDWIDDVTFEITFADGSTFRVHASKVSS